MPRQVYRHRKYKDTYVYIVKREGNYVKVEYVHSGLHSLYKSEDFNWLFRLVTD